MDREQLYIPWRIGVFLSSTQSPGNRLLYWVIVSLKLWVKTTNVLASYPAEEVGIGGLLSLVCLSETVIAAH